MKYPQLKTHIADAKAGATSLDGVYIVYGVDDYLRRQALRQFKSVLMEDFLSFNFAVFDSDEVDGAIEAMNSVPVFDSCKIAVLSLMPDPAEEALKSIKEYIASPIQGSTLVIECSDAIARSLKAKTATEVVCSPLTREELEEELQPILSAPPAMKIAPDALEELCLRTQNSTARITSEIVKLKSYSVGTITKNDVVEMVNADLEYQIYTLTDSVSQKNANRALEIMTSLLSHGIPPRTIVNNLYDRYRRMLHIALNKTKTNDEFARLFGVKSGAIYYMRRSVESYSQVRLKNCVDVLHALQYDILQGKKSEGSAMHEAILTLLAI